MEEAEIIVKRSILQGSAARGGRRSLLRRGETPTAMTRPGRGPLGPWPDLRGLRLTAGRRPIWVWVWVCAGLGPLSLSVSLSLSLCLSVSLSLSFFETWWGLY